MVGRHKAVIWHLCSDRPGMLRVCTHTVSCSQDPVGVTMRKHAQESVSTRACFTCSGMEGFRWCESPHPQCLLPPHIGYIYIYTYMWCIRHYASIKARKGISYYYSTTLNTMYYFHNTGDVTGGAPLQVHWLESSLTSDNLYTYTHMYICNIYIYT